MTWKAGVKATGTRRFDDHSSTSVERRPTDFLSFHVSAVVEVRDGAPRKRGAAPARVEDAATGVAGVLGEALDAR
eukprot:CAMPEP_0119261986 /NCGR_PEP_ID=MMETSP1329-20130426/1868_1 /TAXON_ID=114041 /ORGANISM="Genus nov. species nov., Strain RCC1024" /LENGTH=74 /DNA_ID=CAMNT_0007261593 /DNA_START=38 /DNA_END=261 /DNA_ORIENTATION=+